MIIVGHGYNHKRVSAYNRKLNTITPLLDLPKRTHNITAIRSGMWLYVLGGSDRDDATDDEDEKTSHQFYRLCLDTRLTDESDNRKIAPRELFPEYWEELPPLIQPVWHPVVVSDTCYIYVLGGVLSDSSINNAYMFDKRLFYWTKLPDLPQEVFYDTDDAAVVDGVVYVFLPSTTLVLEVGSNSWKVIDHTTLGKFTEK